MIEPFEGQIFDPACGVCEKKFTDRHCPLFRGLKVTVIVFFSCGNYRMK